MAGEPGALLKSTRHTVQGQGKVYCTIWALHLQPEGVTEGTGKESGLGSSRSRGNATALRCCGQNT